MSCLFILFSMVMGAPPATQPTTRPTSQPAQPEMRLPDRRLSSEEELQHRIELSKVPATVPGIITEQIRRLRLGIADARASEEETIRDAKRQIEEAEDEAAIRQRRLGTTRWMRESIESTRRMAIRSEKERIDQARRDAQGTQARLGNELRVMEALRDFHIASATARVHIKYTQLAKAQAALKRANALKPLAERNRAEFGVVKRAYDEAMAELGRQKTGTSPTSKPTGTQPSSSKTQ